MQKISRKKSPLELVDLILKHNPAASLESISEVISEWGGLFDDQGYDAPDTIDVDCVLTHEQPQSGRLKSEVRQTIKRLNS